VCPHRDLLGCNSMSLNAGGTLALLAGRRSYAIVNLTSPDHLAYKETRQSKWEVVVSEWSPADDRLVAVAANNKVELLSWTGSELVLDTSLRAHTRAVTDITWHARDKQVLATSAADSFIYLWDMRDLRRPTQSLQAVAGAAKIQWNKVSGKYLASAHEGEVKLWDTRNTSIPIQHISAHLSRIYDIDWSYEQEDMLATSSQDSTVQFWNLASPLKSENMIKIPGSPVWKLQHTPVGSGLLTLVMQSVLRGQNNLMLWNTQDLRVPVHTFYSHDMVLDFGWFNPNQSNRAQLVTWSRDCTLRIWDLDSELQRKCGLEIDDDGVGDVIKFDDANDEDEDSNDGFFKFEREEETNKPEEIGLIIEEEGAVVLSSPGSVHMKKEVLDQIQGSESFIPELCRTGSKNKSMNLNYEFSLINVSEKLHVVGQDAKERFFTVSAETDKNRLILHVKFPQNYPNQKAPIFSFLQGTTVDNVTRNNILGKLRNIAKHQISKNRRCLESVLRQFESCLDQLTIAEEEQLKLNNPGQMFANNEALENREDEKIPYPRSSGARFCGDGNLVCFGYSRSYSVSMSSAFTAVNEQTPISVITPRALSAMNSGGVSLALSNGVASPNYSVVGLSLCSTSPTQDSNYLTYQTRVPRVRFSGGKSRFSVTSVPMDDYPHSERKFSTKHSVIGTVTVYSCSGLLPYSKDLAPLYKLPTQFNLSRLEDICNYNAKMAHQVERQDLAHIWSLLSLSASGCSLTSGQMSLPWAMSPFGGQMLEDMIRHFVQIRDVQTAAVICAVFSNRCTNESILGKQTRKKNSKSESLKTDSLHHLKKYSRAQSETLTCDESLNCSNLPIRKVSPSPITDDQRLKIQDNLRMVKPSNNQLHDTYILTYANLLYKWKMFTARAELLKCLSNNEHSHLSAAKLSTICNSCGQNVSGPRCVYCHQPFIRCSICRLPCSGSTVVCPKCSHGGHPQHLQSWFSQHDQCATGCGCRCLNKSHTLST